MEFMQVLKFMALHLHFQFPLMSGLSRLGKMASSHEDLIAPFRGTPKEEKRQKEKMKDEEREREKKRKEEKKWKVGRIFSILNCYAVALVRYVPYHLSFVG